MTHDAAVDLTDDLGRDRDVVRALRPALVDERDVGAEPVGEPPGELAATRVGRHDHRVADLAFDVLDEVLREHRHRGEVVDGVVEETLDLTGVQVDGDDTIRARRRQHVGNETRGDRLAALGLAVLARVAVEGAHRGDALRRRALRRVDHDELLHQRGR